MLAGLALLWPCIATASDTLADCNADAAWRILDAAPSGPATDARAYWLDRQHLQWPAAPQTGRYRLYHSARARIVAPRGGHVAGADGALVLETHTDGLPPPIVERFRFVAPGAALSLRREDIARLPVLLTGQLLLVREDASGRVLDATATQLPGVLDDLYAGATTLDDLGVAVRAPGTAFRLWAPTAQDVSVCLYGQGDGRARQRVPMRRDARTGAWSATLPGDRSGGYYAYLVDVHVPGTGIVRNLVTDPYSISLTTDSKRSYIGDLSSQALKPAGWDVDRAPAVQEDRQVRAATDMVIYELHVRDFSRDDTTVSARNRGKYLAFTEPGSAGMRHLRALADAGLTDVHLLPVFDFAGVPEAACAAPEVPAAAPDSEAQQAAVMAVAARDCFNWGYEPLHFNAPEGSYASDASDGARRIVEFRQMVMALHRAGLRVGMDVVYNHTTASGQEPLSVLDRIVPGYYHRLDANGVGERSTCCANTATEHAMMGKLMIDSTVLWAREYGIDSFRFDLMGHQPRAVMEALDRAVDAAAGHDVQLIGEGWNFGEVANGARFVQASQRSLNGSGIGTFSDRARDALRGGSPGDHGDALVADQGWLNGLVYAPNESADRHRPASDLMHAADLVRVGLAGTLRDYTMATFDGRTVPLSAIDYKGQPAGYASQPSEVVNYVENHDNQTLFDLDAFKLPPGTSREDRARVQLLGVAVTALSQGIAYFHAGIDTLRSKSMDRNSFDSGDWFNRLDWSYRDNHFGTGAPPRADNGADYALIKPRLRDASIRPSQREIAFMRDGFRDWLRVRASSPLFRLRSSAEVQRRLTFPDAGPTQNPVMIVGHLDGAGMDDARFREAMYLINAGTDPQSLELPAQAGKRYVLHPVLRDGADSRARQAYFDPRTGRFTVPARTAVVFVVE